MAEALGRSRTPLVVRCQHEARLELRLAASRRVSRENLLLLFVVTVWYSWLIGSDSCIDLPVLLRTLLGEVVEQQALATQLGRWALLEGVQAWISPETHLDGGVLTSLATVIVLVGKEALLLVRLMMLCLKMSRVPYV